MSETIRVIIAVYILAAIMLTAALLITGLGAVGFFASAPISFIGGLLIGEVLYDRAI